MKPGRLVQPVGDGQSQAGGVRALGPDGPHRSVVKGPEGYFRAYCDHVLVNDCAGPEEFGARVRALLDQILNQTEEV